ncbi:unnamed protein product [Camellia sinensis]
MECQQQIQKMGESRRKRGQGDHGWLFVPHATDSHGKNEETSSDMLKNTPSNIRRWWMRSSNVRAAPSISQKLQVRLMAVMFVGIFASFSWQTMNHRYFSANRTGLERLSMAGALVGGAALGAAFGELLKVVEDVAIKAVYFKSIVKRIESILNQITPKIEEIKNLNRVLDRSEKETAMFTDQLRDAQKLVRSCAKVKWWNYCARSCYSNRLLDFEKSLVRFFQIEVQAMQLRDGMKILMQVNEMDSKLDRIGTMGGSFRPIGFVGWCGVPGVPEFVVGFDEPLRELKMQILNEGEQVVVLSAPGGCGKTTLAKMLCHDKEIEGPRWNPWEELGRAMDNLPYGCQQQIQKMGESRRKRGQGDHGWLFVPHATDSHGKNEETSSDMLKNTPSNIRRWWMRSSNVRAAPSISQKLQVRLMAVMFVDMFENNIFFVTFSKSPNLKVIIEKMFQHKDSPVPEFQTEEDAINQLESLLKRIGPTPILLVLDDVWPGSEFLTEKFKFQISKYKILVTSRSVFPRFSTYKLKLLKDQDAMDLFCHSAFPQHGRSSIPKDLVSKIMRRCGGFPLALKVVGRSLHGEPEVIWKNRLKPWSEAQSILYSNNELLICLQPSLDALDGMYKIKECFLDLASFPEDQRIPVTALMDMWVELYNLDEDGEDAIAILHQLSNRNLVNLVLTRKDASETNGYYNEHFVMQHDLLRDLAIHQSDQNPIEHRKRLIVDIVANDLPRWWIEQREHPVHAHLVSISTDEMFSSNWHNMQLPEVEVLVLNIQARNYKLPQFMGKMDRLKVLIITNYGFCSAELSNSSLLGHLLNVRRIRFEHISILSISKSMLQMKSLRKISFVMCKIDEAFRNCKIQVPNMLPNLAEIVIDYCNDLVEFPAWICNIVSLTKLSITNCHELISLPEGLGNLENLEVLRLHACTKLLELPESIGSLQRLSFLDISDCISMSTLPGRMGELCGLRKLHMRGCRGLSELPYSVKDLKQLKDLVCDEETAHLWEHYKIHLTNLKLNVLKEDVNLDWLT